MRVWLFFIGCFIFSTGLACEVVDDTGQRVKLTHPARRIISLAPDLTENLFAIGAGDNIVGVMRGSDYPIAAQKIQIVASYNSVDAETILALHPDLIVAWSEERFAMQLKELGIPVYLSHPRQLVDIPVTLQKLGCLVGKEVAAKYAADNFSRRLENLQKKYTYKKKVSLFYQVWPKPLMTITKSSWIHDVVVLCGGKNLFENLKGAAPEIDLEAVVFANPDVIIGSDLSLWQEWPQMMAVKKQHLFSIDPDLIARASPRLLDGAEVMCKELNSVRN